MNVTRGILSERDEASGSPQISDIDNGFTTRTSAPGAIPVKPTMTIRVGDFAALTVANYRSESVYKSSGSPWHSPDSAMQGVYLHPS